MPSIPLGRQVYVPTMDILRDRMAGYLRSERKWIRDFLGEFLGTTFLVAVGDAAVAQMVLSRKTHGEFFSVTFTFAMAITFGVYISGNTSGGHINPAVTLLMVLMGRTSWGMLPIYWLAQYAGGIFGAGIVYMVYRSAINNFDGGVRSVTGPNATAGIFATYPQPFVTSWDGCIDQVVGTAILTMCIFAVTDPRNVVVPAHFLPLLVGLVVGMIGIYMEYGWFWVPIVGPHIGAFMGTILYMTFVGIHWPTTFDPSIRKREHVEMHPHAHEEHVQLTKPTIVEPEA